MTDRAWALLLIAVILAVFLPAFSAEICRVDDAQLLDGLQQLSQWSLRDVFLPGTGGGLYYRPLTILSFFVNKTAFGLSSLSLHAENVLLHLANTLLAFFLTRLLLAQDGSTASSRIAFIGGLLFGLHPIVTESVNWISGRTDLFMGFYLLTSALLLVLYRATGKRYLPWLAALAFLAALLAKELAIAFLPGYFLLLYAKKQTHDDQSSYSSPLRKKILIIGGVTLLVAGTFLLLRTVAFTSNSSRIGVTLQYMQINPGHSFSFFLRAIGFYLKKLLLPWPLNFAIVEVDPLYELAAIPLIGLSIHIALQGTILSALFTAGLLLFTPALLIALNQIAWTPYAERYLYTSTAFISIATVTYCSRQHFPLAKVWRLGLLAVLLGLTAATTFQRNLTWKTNRRILADTAQKAPSFPRIQWLYGAALSEEGNYQQALIYSQRAAALRGSPLDYDPIPDINLGYIQYHLGKIPAAIETFESVVKKTSDHSPHAREGLMDCYRLLWARTTDNAHKQKYFKAMQFHGERLFALRPDPLIYYTLGKMALANNERGEAQNFFTQAAAHMSEGHEFLPFAQKLSQH